MSTDEIANIQDTRRHREDGSHREAPQNYDPSPADPAEIPAENSQAEAENSVRGNGYRGRRGGGRGGYYFRGRFVTNEDRLRSLVRKKDRDLVETLQVANVAERELAALKIKYEEITDLLKVRTDDLQAAQSFLTKSDQISDAEVVRMVNNLNSCIFQVAAQLADGLTFPTEPSSNEPSQTDLDSYISFIGRELTEALVGRRHADDPTLVQIAFQSCTTHFIVWLAAQWNINIGAEKSNEEAFEKAYRFIREREPQTVAARWRVLTIGYLNSQRKTDEVVQSMYESLIGRYVDVAASSGIREPRQAIRDTVIGICGPGVTEIVRSTLDFGSTVMEKAMGNDFAIIAVPGESSFVATSMVDDYGEEDEKETPNSGFQWRVLGTTQVGLEKSEKIGDIITPTVILKPKVVLSNMLGLEGDEVKV
ncbi:hypothetical protein C8Q75DRAFT_737166 [Abortiporus biennis]|nr:hypothetical protein C8Q75DRAFT_737166 [Abortiporus biennis]